MTNTHCDYIPINDLLKILNELDIKQKDAYQFCGISKQQFFNWKKKGRMPAKNFWAFQNSLTIFLEEEKIRKMVKLGIISKEFLREVLEI